MKVPSAPLEMVPGDGLVPSPQSMVATYSEARPFGSGSVNVPTVPWNGRPSRDDVSFPVTVIGGYTVMVTVSVSVFSPSSTVSVIVQVPGGSVTVGETPLTVWLPVLSSQLHE